jgi:hypothetical protein
VTPSRKREYDECKPFFVNPIAFGTRGTRIVAAKS